MTLLEFFTEAHIDNIASCLRLNPEDMIIVGDIDQMLEPIKWYRNLLKHRKQRTKITVCDVQGKDLDQISDVLRRLVCSDDQVVIDVTGGDETVLLAVGAVLAELNEEQRRSIRVEKFDHEHDVVLDCLNRNCKHPAKAINLTVDELISLHGGSIYLDAYQPSADCRCSELDGLWDIVSHMPRTWNQSISYLNEFESRSDSKTQIYLHLSDLRDSIQKYEQKEQAVRELLEKLGNAGVIYNNSSYASLEYSYSSPILRYCTLKAGNVLEVKTLLEGRDALENGKPLFHDSRMSVSIDWDGVVNDSSEKDSGTRNEIDVILMHGTTPLFVSCKNGNIGDELYKLHTVATRFGGPYARKMLIATDLDQMHDRAYQALTQRAEDMKISLVDAAELTPQKWPHIFIKAMR